jgi:DNA-directed RNA polymerase subunit RPC12/RpoP
MGDYLKVKRICKTCGKEFAISSGKIEKGWGIYCSKDCRGKAERGENSPNYVRIKCICKNCGKEFLCTPSSIKNKKELYCSTECRTKYKKSINKVMYTCKTCGKEFETYYSLIKKGRKFCSRECFLKSIRGEKSIHWKGGNKIHICQTCGKEFEVTYNKDKDGWGKYCSHECLREGFGKKFKGNNNPNWRGGKVKCICQECGEEFYVNQYKIKEGMGKYCSKKCKDKSCIGEGSPFWKGGTTYFPYCPKFNKRRREAVRKFFNYKCLMCGTDQRDLKRKLSVHHIDHDKEQGCDGKPFNLIPLCINCHAQERSREEEYAIYINNTLEEGFKWGIWNREEYIESVMYPDN